MSLFLIVFFLIYSSMHLYVFLKAWHAFRFHWPVGTAISVVFFIMIMTPVLVRILERGGHDFSGRIVSYGGYTWAGLLFLFFAISLSIDVCRFFAYLASLLTKMDSSVLISSYKLFFFIPLLGSLFITLYGHYEAGNIRTETLRVVSGKIPASVGKITIVQISDVHLGLMVREKHLEKIVRLIRLANPDVLVSTGDLVDGDMDRLNGLAEMLKGIKPRYGKFAITGNHEFYAGVENAVSFTENSGFVVLRGKGVTIQGLMNIAGVDDPAGSYFHQLFPPEKVILSGLPQELFTLLLKHRPLIDKEAAAQRLFDLQLSGHTHKGQIFPFRYLVRFVTPFFSGHYRLQNNADLYVSRGSGTWGPPIRFLASPEITVIELVHIP